MASTANKSSIQLFPLLLVNFIGTLGYSIIIPFLVFLVTRFGGNAMIYGILGSTYPLFQMIGAPILGRWSDQIGRKKVLLISQAGTALSWIIFVIALSLPVTQIFSLDSRWIGAFSLTLPLVILFFARALDGLTGGNVSVANAYLADITDESNRQANFGKLSASGNLGFIIGPTIAGLLGSTVYGEIIPVLAALCISLIAIFVIAAYLPESKCMPLETSPDQEDIRKVLGQEQKDCYEIEEKEKISFFQLLRLPFVTYMLVLYFFIFLGFNIFYTAFPIHVSGVLGWDVRQLGLFFSMLSGLLILVQGPILTYLSKQAKISDEVLVLFGSFVLAFTFICLIYDHPFLVYFSALFFALGNGLMWPSFLSILSRIAEPRYQGYLQGVAASLGSFASILGLLTGGFVYGFLEARTFLFAAIIIFMVFFLSFRLLSIAKSKKD